MGDSFKVLSVWWLRRCLGCEFCGGSAAVQVIVSRRLQPVPRFLMHGASASQVKQFDFSAASWDQRASSSITQNISILKARARKEDKRLET